MAGGTGHEAALPGQTAAGKTGTAQTGQFSGVLPLKSGSDGVEVVHPLVLSRVGGSFQGGTAL